MLARLLASGKAKAPARIVRSFSTLRTDSRRDNSGNLNKQVSEPTASHIP
jgi:hypothetical protein